MPNMGHDVARHNVQILKGNTQSGTPQPGCNCRGGPASCPVQGRCQTESVVYRATVNETTTGKTETYTRGTGNTFKERFYGHRSDTRHQGNRHNTCLADHIWCLKEQGKVFETKWSLVERASPFNPTTRKCGVCLKEKSHILYNRTGASLNNRNDIFNTCRHRTQKLLVNVKS